MTLVNLGEFKNRPSLTHLKRLTTKDGLIQHADFEVPDPSFGYSIDDNARALIACLWHYKIFQDPSVLSLAEIYFDYIKKVEQDGGTFHNFLSFTEKILDAEGSEDSIGRAIWALGEVVRHHPDENAREEAKAIISRANINRHLEHQHIHTKAYILLGLACLGKEELANQWADHLVGIFDKESKPDWQWFENSLRYDNAIIPYALAVAYQITHQKKHLEVAKETFDWLDSVSRVNGTPAPIGQTSWYFRGEEKSLFDQQPVDTAGMVLCANKLFEITTEKKYLDKAVKWMNWYYGNNTMKVSVINHDTGGVYDAITPGGVNKNQGAESIITYLLAYLTLSSIALSTKEERPD